MPNVSLTPRKKATFACLVLIRKTIYNGLYFDLTFTYILTELYPFLIVVGCRLHIPSFSLICPPCINNQNSNPALCFQTTPNDDEVQFNALICD